MERLFCPPRTFLHILEENGYTASKIEKLRGFGTGPARFMVKASWEATWEPEDRLCQDDAHRNLVNEYRAMHLDIPPRKLWASNIDQQQPMKLQQGLNAKQAACNAYHAGFKERLRISTAPINPDLDIHATGQAAIQCEMMPDCYAQDGDNETRGTMRALAFNAEGHYISSLSPDRMGLLQHWHRHLDVFEEDVIALLERYKHGNESTGHTIQINDLWQLSPDLHDCLRAKPMLLPEQSHLIWDRFSRGGKRVKTDLVRNALRLRYGAFWNAKLAVHFQKPYLSKPSDGKCPLCKQLDSGNHTLGACTHRHMKGLYIETQ